MTISDKGLWRDLVSFWILGLCNNFGYVVMLTAAHDIISGLSGDSKSVEIEPLDVADGEKRECNILSTGAILLADILPSLMVKYTAPFLPFYPFIRVAICIVFATSGFICVAYAETLWLALFGVALTSFSSGLGEVTFLAYSSLYNKNVVSTWSSGTGGAGVLGALSYSVLAAFLTAKQTLLVMVVVPALEALAFYLLLRHPDSYIVPPDVVSEDVASREVDEKPVEAADGSTTVLTPEEEPLIGLKAKIAYIPSLFKYILPLTLVYLFEYFINQGLFELIYFPDIFLDKHSQYRWLQVDYQIGVFISRSSVNIVKIRFLWLMAILQGINVILFSIEAIYYVSPAFWLVLAFVFWEGLLGGGAYVNTFYRISEEVPPARRLFALGVTAIADSTGIALAGFLAMPAHNAICKLPVPGRLQ